MKELGKIYDKRILATNSLIEMTLNEYYDLSKSIIKNNEFQRKRVKSSSTVYSLLKDDLKKGCLMPPIVLALKQNNNTSINENTDTISILKNNLSDIIILDGLQRTYTIQELVEEPNLFDDREEILNNPLRIELYISLSKINILYRMLTLNTGQTPMSTRHQIEIIYSDYIKTNILDGVTLLREIDSTIPNKKGEYKFQDIVEGFTSYITKDFLTMDRTDILNNIRNIENLSREKENKDLFLEFLSTYNKLAEKIIQMSNNLALTFEELERDNPFARNITDFFAKSQVMTGFGAAIGKLIELNSVNDFNEVKDKISQIQSFNISNDFKTIIIDINTISKEAKKIGNMQRYYFYYFFRYLFDKNQDCYLNIGNTANAAMNKYRWDNT